jgi:predicted transcriptional regulator of viral defense system
VPFFDEVARVAAQRHGVITRSQLRACGCSERGIRTLTANGVLERRERGVYVVAGSPPTWRQRVLVACSAGGPLALAGHRCASSLWGFDRYRAGTVELTAPYQSARMRPGLLVHRSTELPARDRTVLDGIPVTSPARTLIDVGRYMTPIRLGAMVDDAVRRDLTSYRSSMSASSRWPGLVATGS